MAPLTLSAVLVRSLLAAGFVWMSIASAASQAPNQNQPKRSDTNLPTGESSGPSEAAECSGPLASPKVKPLAEDVADRFALAAASDPSPLLLAAAKNEDDLYSLFLSGLQGELNSHLQWQDPNHQLAYTLKEQLSSHAWLGVQIQAVSLSASSDPEKKQQNSVIVVRMPGPNSPAAGAGIEMGDVINAVNGQSIRTAEDLTQKIAAMGPGATVSITIVRKGETKTFPVTLAGIDPQGQMVPNPTNPQTIKTQIRDCFPALGRAQKALEDRRAKIAQAESEQQRGAAQGLGSLVTDCRGALASHLGGTNPIIDDIVLQLEDRDVQAAASEVAESLKGEEVLDADVANPPSSLARLSDIFRKNLRIKLSSLPTGRLRGVVQSWLENMTVRDLVSCFPPLLTAMREFAPRVQTAVEAAQRRHENELAQSKLPANVLATAYAAYIDVKKCQAAREGYADVYISDPELDQAKAAVREIEDVIKPKLGADTDTDKIWSQVTQTEGRRFDPARDFQQGQRYMCQSRLALLLHILHEEVPESAKLKKDF